MSTTIGKHFADVAFALAKIDTEQIAHIVDLIETASVTLICGNGGSAATAIHFASDLRSIGCPAFDLLSPSKVTQIGNDCGYENVFQEQTRHFDSLVIAFSGSGTSRNIAALCHILPERLILFTSDMNELCYPGVEMVTVFSSDYEVIEDVHLAICHAIKKELIERGAP